MPPERTNQEPYKSTRHHRESANLSPNMNATGAGDRERRRGMDLESMLNPPDEDERASFSPSLSSTSTRTCSDRTLPLGPVLGLSTHPSRSRGHSRGSRGSSRGSRGSSRGLIGSSGGTAFSPSARSDSSRSSLSPGPDVPARVRRFRPAYSLEHSDFIWFHRIDLSLSWEDITEAFRLTFNGAHEELRKTDGLQCKYYRIRAQNAIPRVRASSNTSDVPSQYGMWIKTGRRYPWMQEYSALLPGT